MWDVIGRLAFLIAGACSLSMMGFVIGSWRGRGLDGLRGGTVGAHVGFLLALVVGAGLLF